MFHVYSQSSNEIKLFKWMNKIKCAAVSGAIFSTVLHCITNACIECQNIPEYGYLASLWE